MAAYTTIDDPSAYFKVQLYTGDGSTPSITFDDTDTDMQPDLVWIKNRDQADSHCLFDAVRGATEMLNPDTDTAEATDADTLTSFDSDGFALGADVKVNTNTEKYVSWNWKANGTGSSNTDGSINTTATSANTTSGFSISTYTGTGSAATIGHGLGSIPKMIILKSRVGTDIWAVYNIGMTSAPETDFMSMARTDATSDSDTFWNDTAPTSTVFSVGTSADINDSGDTNVAYCFAEKQGFSKFGSYVGNGDGSSDENGPFIYTGFRPAFVITKSIDSTTAWLIFDTKRLGYNPSNNRLYTQVAAAEGAAGASTDSIDFLSNGFKIKTTITSTSHANKSGDTYIYMAFAEAPFVNSNGVPCNAR